MRYYSILLSFMFICSCAARSPYPMNISLKGWYQEDIAQEVILATYEAYKLLRDCEELQTYVHEYDKIMQLQQNLIVKIATDSEINIVREELGSDFCGYVRLSKNTIYLNPYNFGLLSGCNYTRTIGHEMLHLGGFEHDTTEKTKEFNELLRSCNISK